MVRVAVNKNKDDLSKKAVKKKTQQTKKVSNKDKPEYQIYQKWVKSKGFKQLRAIALERDGYRCQCCGRTLEDISNNKKISLQCHHIRYDNVGKGNEEELKDLIILDSICHHAIHSAKSNLTRFTDKSPILDNIKENPLMECRIKTRTI